MSSTKAVNEIMLSPADARRQAIIENACDLFRSLLGEHIDKAVEDANESFVSDENETEPEAKLGFTLSFPTLTRAPEVVLKVAWNARRTDEATAKVDPDQAKLPLGDADYPKPAEKAASRFVRTVQRSLKDGGSMTISSGGNGVRIDKNGVTPVGGKESAA